MNFYTYIHCKPNGDPFYVGKGCDGQRKRSHDMKNGRNQHHRYIVAKYGVENICVFVFPCESEQQAFADEIQQIALLRKEGYELSNKTDGGEGISGLKVSNETKAKMSMAAKRTKNFTGHTHSEATRAKISVAQVGKILSVEHKIKISLAQIGRIQKPVTGETRKKLRESHLGKPWSTARRAAQIENLTDCTRNKIGKAMRGKRHSIETRKKISASMKGMQANNKGIPHTPEHCAKLSKALMGNKRRLGGTVTKETRLRLSLAAKKQWEQKKMVKL